MDISVRTIWFIMCILNYAIQATDSNPTPSEISDNDIDVPPMGTCRQECAGYNTGCPAGQVCCRTGCGHICQPKRCPKLKLTPYPFCLTHCPFQGVENKNLRSFCLCYNACMNVRCGRDEMCVPKQSKCDKGSTCLPLGVCVNVNKFTDHGIVYLMKGKDISMLNDAAPKEFFMTSE